MSRKKSLFIFVGLILALITITGFRVNSHLNIVQKKDYLEDNYEVLIINILIQLFL